MWELPERIEISMKNTKFGGNFLRKTGENMEKGMARRRLERLRLVSKQLEW
jgi:hypothetical protein